VIRSYRASCGSIQTRRILRFCFVVGFSFVKYRGRHLITVGLVQKLADGVVSNQSELVLS
jgi:hypothetical protein